MSHTPGKWIAYTPTWTATGGTPAVGSGGSITGAYIKQGELCHVQITCLMGTSPTTGSTTNWMFSLTFTIDTNAVSGTAYFYDADSSLRMGFVGRGTGGTGVYVFSDASALVGASVPITWATNDYITINLTYRVAA